MEKKENEREEQIIKLTKEMKDKSIWYKKVLVDKKDKEVKVVKYILDKNKNVV